MRNHLSRKILTSMLLCLLLLLAACGDNGFTKSATPTPAGDPNQLVTYTLGIPADAMNSPQVGEMPGNTPMHVKVTFKTNDQVLNQLGGNDQSAQEGQQQDVGSLANQIGISDATYQRIKAFFGVQGATLTLGKLHTSLSIDANASMFANLLQTKFVYHELNGRKFFTPAKIALQLPRFIVDNLEAVTGLDNYSLPPHSNASLTSLFSKSSAQSKADDGCTIDTDTTGPVVLPQEVAHAYGIDQSWNHGWTGKGITIDLIEFEAFNPDDIQHYFDCVGYKGTLKTVDVDNTPELTGQEVEAPLDIEMLAGIAPDADIVVYQTGLPSDATGNDFWGYFLDQLDQIIADNANSKSSHMLSISWGASELFATTELEKALESRFRILYKTEHMTTFDASGDCAAYDSGQFGRLSVDIPANIPWVTSVGGTVLNVAGQGNRASEVVWSDGRNKTKCGNAWGSGGGLSTYFKAPTWQSSAIRGLKSKYSNGFRQVPDLSAVAFNLPIYLNEQWLSVGGTSAATPIWAASLAVLNQGLISQTGYYVYGPQIFYIVFSNSGKAHPYFDIQRGNNLYYSAGTGWDFASGLGVPNLVDFQNVLVQLIKNSKK